MSVEKDILYRLNKQNISVFTANDIIDLTSYDNLRKSLERMTKAGIIRRLIRGVYEIRKYNKTFNTIAAPSIDEIAKALARNFNWDIYPSGNYALNILVKKLLIQTGKTINIPIESIIEINTLKYII